MIPIVSVLMATHIVEVTVWAAAYALVDAAPENVQLVYFALVNYATLGYGAIVPVDRWKLLGPVTAMNGALMFGWRRAPRRVTPYACALNHQSQAAVQLSPPTRRNGSRDTLVSLRIRRDNSMYPDA